MLRRLIAVVGQRHSRALPGQGTRNTGEIFAAGELVLVQADASGVRTDALSETSEVVSDVDSDEPGGVQAGVIGRPIAERDPAGPGGRQRSFKQRAHTLSSGGVSHATSRTGPFEPKRAGLGLGATPS